MSGFSLCAPKHALIQQQAISSKGTPTDTHITVIKMVLLVSLKEDDSSVVEGAVDGEAVTVEVMSQVSAVFTEAPPISPEKCPYINQYF